MRVSPHLYHIPESILRVHFELTLSFQATSLRSELHVMHASLVDAQSELERYKESLTLAENRLERVKRESATNLTTRTQGNAQGAIKPGTPRPKSEPADERDVTEPNVRSEVAVSLGDLADNHLLSRLMGSKPKTRPTTWKFSEFGFEVRKRK